MLIVVVGVVAALIAALANPLGIGHAGFGWKQGALLAAGIVLIIVGGAVTLRALSSGSGGTPADQERTPPPGV
jgi:hypothetical protein